MPTFDITDEVVADLGVGSADTARWSNTGFTYDHAVNGIPFLSAIHDAYPNADVYQRGFVPQRKAQFDAAQDPGEQSLDGWWLRSQSSFHGGAGVTYMEPASDTRVMRRFRDSLGVDPWTRGSLTCLPTTSLGSSQSGLMFGAAYAGSVYWFYGNTIDRAGSTTALTGAGTLLSVTDNGTTFYRLTTAGLYSGTIASGGDAAYYTTTPTSGVLGWVKGRLVAGLNNSIYELTGAGAPTLPTAIYTHPNSSWRWTSITEGPSAIYAAGYAGGKSAIYKFTVDQALSGTSLPALTKGTVVAELPTNEIVTAITGYLGTFMGVGTTKGARIATVDGNGDIAYGPLLWTEGGVFSWFGQDRFLYAGTKLSTGGGLVRFDLSDPDDAGFYPYATDLQGKLASSYAIAIYPTSTGLAFPCWTGSASQAATQGTSLETGWVRTGFVRYGTLEPKAFKSILPRFTIPASCGITVSTIDENDNEVTLSTLGSTSDSDDLGITYPAGSRQKLGFKFTLTPNGTTGPTLQGWQSKALPATARKEQLLIPLLCSDFEQDKNGVRAGQVGSAKLRHAALRDAVRSGDTVVYQDLGTGEQLTVVVDDVQFTQVANPWKSSAFSGILTVTLREV